MITLQELKGISPAIFQTEKSPKLTDRYSMVPTIEIIDKFTESGWEISFAKQIGDGLYSKHMVKMRNSILPKVGDSLVEAIITNSHDGLTKLQIGAGLFRVACSNGLIIPQQDLIDFNQRHLKITSGDVSEITENFVKSVPIIERSVNRMMDKRMNIDEKVDFVNKAVGIRWKNTEDISTLTLQTIIEPMRVEDYESTLWNTFNVVQEKLIRGGFVKEQNDKSRKVKEIKSLNMDTYINKKLWELAETYI
jgi:hypothetical protein